MATRAGKGISNNGVSKCEREERRGRRHGASLRVEGEDEEEEEETLAAREDQA